VHRDHQSKLNMPLQRKMCIMNGQYYLWNILRDE